VEFKEIYPVVIIIVGIAILLSIGIYLAEQIEDETSVQTVESSTKSILTNYNVATTLTPIGEGITSNSILTKNRTWLNFTDDYVLTDRYDTISFWYKNDTTPWTFVVNSSGTLYVNGSLGTPGIYPIYDNGSDMFIGKLNITEFFNGSIDDFRGYNNSINADLINLTYQGGRLWIN